MTCYAVFYVLHGKSYYLAPVYPMLLAAGAVVIEFALDRPETGQPRMQWLKPVVAIILIASGAHLLPIVVPVLSPRSLSRLHQNSTLPNCRLPSTRTQLRHFRSGIRISLDGKKSRTKPRSPGIESQSRNETIAASSAGLRTGRGN